MALNKDDKDDEDFFSGPPSPVSNRTRLPTQQHTLHEPDRPLTRRERKSVKEAEYQRWLMKVQKVKTQEGQQYMGELSTSAARIFVKAVGEIWGIPVTVNNPGLVRYCCEFLANQIKHLSLFLEEGTAAGQHLIYEEMQRTIRIEVQKRPLSWWERTFGTKRDEDEDD
jgi:hypothetical protein